VTVSDRPISGINGPEMAAPKQPFPPMPRSSLLSLQDSATISDAESQEEVK
jgi:hypothetical protein